MLEWALSEALVDLGSIYYLGSTVKVICKYSKMHLVW